jgi:hypothetical protein
MTPRLLAFAVVAFAASLIATPPGRADEPAGQKKNKNKGPDIEAIFKKLDADNDGKLSSTEFATAMQELRKKKEGAEAKKPGKGAKRAELLFAKLDADKNGTLSLAEFKTVIEVMKEMKQQKKNK